MVPDRSLDRVPRGRLSPVLERAQANDAQAELKEKLETIASKEEELAALKARFAEQQEQNRARRGALEEERDARLQALRSEVSQLRARGAAK